MIVPGRGGNGDVYDYSCTATGTRVVRLVVGLDQITFRDELCGDVTLPGPGAGAPPVHLFLGGDNDMGGAVVWSSVRLQRMPFVPTPQPTPVPTPQVRCCRKPPPPLSFSHRPTHPQPSPVPTISPLPTLMPTINPGAAIDIFFRLDCKSMPSLDCM